MRTLAGFAVALILFCIPPCPLAQETGGGVMQGVGSAVTGAAKEAGANAAGQVMQNLGMMSPSPTASPGQSQGASADSAAEGSPTAAPPAAQMPEGVPSVPQIPAAMPSPPGY